MNQDIIDKKAREVLMHKSKSEGFCDFCEHPQDGTFERRGSWEYYDDGYCICGLCLMEISCRFPFLAGMNLGIKIDELRDEQPIRLPF